MDALIYSLREGTNLIENINEAIRLLGILAIVLILIIGFVFFLPTIIASLRHIKLRAFVCVVNVIGISTFFLSFYIPIIIWLVLMIVALVGKKEYSMF